MRQAAAIARRRGGPLAMLALVLTAWTGARAVLWESPFAPLEAVLAIPTLATVPEAIASPSLTTAPSPAARAEARQAMMRTGTLFSGTAAALGNREYERARLAAAQTALWQAALRQPTFQRAGRSGFTISGSTPQDSAPFLPPPQPAPLNPARPQPWSLDAWAFWRQGSNTAPVSQGRVPIYGASQIGALLQYRLATRSARDPRLYARAYRALVPRGENELALGASIRPLGKVPLRMAGELRYTDAAFTNELRPSVYIVTEMPPIPLIYGTQLDAYGQAGWVGGASATAFADGQASLTRDVPVVGRVTGDDLRLSFGAAAWGGAQEDAQRLDVGPTLRLDLTVGEVPARISIDWRERVAGQAGPDSGLAATVSARF